MNLINKLFIYMFDKSLYKIFSITFRKNNKAFYSVESQTKV